MTIEETIAAAVEAKLRPVLEELRAIRADLRPASTGVRPTEVEWLSPAEVAREINVKTETVRAWVKRGKLKATRVERALRIHRSDVRRFMEEAASSNLPERLEALTARLRKLRVAP